MRKLLLAAALAATVITAPAAKAETIDVATVKCSDLASMPEDEVVALFIWILGYVGGQAGITTLDKDGVETFGKDMGEYCAANPDVGVLSAAADAASD